MTVSRRDFGKLVFLGVSEATLLLANTWAARAQAPGARPNRSLINGVQFGLQPFCYHDLAMTAANRGELIRRLVRNGMGMVELHATWVEPAFTGAGISPSAARDKLRAWRLNPPAGYYQGIRKELDTAGVEVFTYYINFDDTFTDHEIDAVFEGCKVLGARGCVGSMGQAVAKRLAPFPGRHGMFVGLHNHDNLSDPDAFASEQSMVTGLSMSPDFKMMLDVRHFTAADGDAVAFLERHHDRIAGLHVGDRRKHNGRSAPFGEGDAPIIELLRTIRDNRWPIVALLEFEHGTLRPEVEEVDLMFDYCKRAVA
jgi:sugar phosphate isomerase/epimerase